MTESRQLALLRRHGIRPKRSLSQNFLVDESWLGRIADAARLDRDALVLEIGAGLGGLTHYLAEAARQVIAVELDDVLAEILEGEFADRPNVRILHADATAVDPSVLAWDGDVRTLGFVAVGNLPYHAGNRILRHLYTGSVLRPKRVVALVQSDVADRICARPGDMSLLSVSCQLHADVKPLLRLPAGAFLPRPRVRSTLLELTTRPDLPCPSDAEDVMRVARAAFGQRRKQLAKTLGATLAVSRQRLAENLRKAGIDPARRPETLSVDEWKAAASAVAEVRRSK
ncbi:MAG: 16S rRNA (adenine(1518)-N(6)/adenine(1519)-N(6))-dimethyltransferase RsmA [Caldilineaceae bacterium]|nr:16S rRNA (adenine(1518)-N(6)/adenine(1519)-N(6))-dimethyltransferase RsmA [Caldilineaceae bacterium]